MKTKLIYALVAVLTLSFTACGNNRKNADNNDNPSAQVAEVHNSRNSVDYEGTYTGTMPCADCAGIDVELTLQAEDYTLKTVYQGKEVQGQNTFTETGKYTWNTEGNIITLNNDSTQQYQVGENVLYALDEHGREITGDLAEKYILKKQ